MSKKYLTRLKPQPSGVLHNWFNNILHHMHWCRWWGKTDSLSQYSSKIGLVNHHNWVYDCCLGLQCSVVGSHCGGCVFPHVFWHKQPYNLILTIWSSSLEQLWKMVVDVSELGKWSGLLRLYSDRTCGPVTQLTPLSAPIRGTGLSSTQHKPTLPLSLQGKRCRVSDLYIYVSTSSLCPLNPLQFANLSLTTAAVH